MTNIDRRRLLAGSAVLVAAGSTAMGAASAQETTIRPATGKMAKPDKASDPHAEAITALSSHVASVRYEDIPSATIELAKHRVLDLVGCVIGGAHTEGQEVLVDMARRAGAAPECSIIGWLGKFSAGEAALVNAVSARAWDYEVMTIVVGDLEMESHHSPTTSMTALALSERDHRSGMDFLTALIVGDDISARLLAATGVDFGKGWSPPPLFSSFGATAVAAKLGRLDAAQIQNAFGLSVDQICGTGQSIWDGALNWKLAQGLVARNAIFCTQLATGGWSGMNDALGAPFGFYAQFTAGCARPEVITRDLGKAFYAEAYFKPYPQCAATHPAIETAFALREEHGLKPQDISKIIVRVQPRTLGLFMSKPFQMRPSAHSQANFSLTFAVANALRHGSFLLQHYSPEAMRDPILLDLIAKISIEAMPTGVPGIRLEVTTLDRRSFMLDRTKQASRYPRMGGSSYEQIVEKFHQQVAFAGVDRTKADKIVERVDKLESERDMSVFVEQVMS